MEDAEVRRLLELKREIRQAAGAARRQVPDKDRRSSLILARAAELPQYKRAVCVMFYVDRGPEVRTRPLISKALAEGKQVVVPYCQGENLQAFLLEDLAELRPGTLGILEPAEELRCLAPQRRVRREKLQMIFVPGVAFDRRGGRIGHGKGYYDRFLPALPPNALRVGLAYKCQVLDCVPMLPWDAPVDVVITEEAIYWGDRQSSGNHSEADRPQAPST